MNTVLLLSLLARAAEPPSNPTDTSPAPVPWNVDEAHGPTHPAKLDLREGTWMSVDAQGDRLVFDLLGDIWSIPATGGDATRLTSGASWDAQPRFSPDGKKIAFVSDRDGNEQIWVMNADGSEPRRITDEKVARVTEPLWDPSGDWILARRRTVDTRSIGVTELWQYSLVGSKGFALTSKDAHPHAGEATTNGRYVWFSSRSSRFEYDHDPMNGLWSVWRLDRKTGDQLPIVQGAGSASRPVLSPDGKQLAFLSRSLDRTELEIVDLATGKRKVVGDFMDRDEMEAFALHGTYPQIAWTGKGLYLWAQGKLWNVQPDGTKAEIPFHAVGEWAFRDVQRWEHSVPDEVQAKVIRWPSWSPDGNVAFSALGALWIRRADGAVERISEGTGYSPAWSPDGTRLAWTSWKDDEGGRLHVTAFKKGKKGADEVLPVEGQLLNPAWSADGTQLVALRGVGGGTSPDLLSTPYYEIQLFTKEKKGWSSKVVTTIGTRGTSRATHLYLHDGRVWFMEDRGTEPRAPSETVLVSVTTDGLDKRTHLKLGGAEEVAISPDFTRVAYKLQHQAYVTALPMWGGGEVAVGDGVPTNQLTQVVGDWLGWTPDGKAVTWTEGPVLKKKPLEGIGLPYDVPPPGQKDWDAGVDRLDVNLTVPRARPEGVKAYTHARVVTMKGDEVLEDATIVVDRDRIVSVTAKGAAPEGAEVVDCTGKTIIPGLIDVHAHLHYTAGDVLPEQEWRYEVALDFGVTTVHDPSASTDLVFTQAERVEAGFEKGPRVFSTGYVLYGALANDGAETPDKDAAKHHIQRLQAVGAFSVKVYQQSQRERRQWYAESCYEQQVLCVPEGGGDLFMNLGMVQDGYHAIEHALPESPLYADVREFFAASRTSSSRGTAYTPTLLVAYGGLSGENYYYQYMNPMKDERMRRHWPSRELDALLWRQDMVVQGEAWNFQSVARDAAKMSREGVMVTLGAHGQIQGIGVHWELWGLAGPGAMTPHEALRSATINGATYLGLDKELGSVEAGKLADFVVLDKNPLEDIHNSDDIAFTVKNGEIWR